MGRSRQAGPSSLHWRQDPLGFLTAPVEPATFLSRIYEREPLVNAGGASSRFTSLLSLAALDRFLASADLREGMVTLAKGGKAIASDRYVEVDGRISGVAVADEYSRGATIVFPQLHESIRELGDFCRALETIFSCQVTTNIYLTPSGNQGFPPHYDNHDVFVMQVSGRKAWRLYQTIADSPYRGERFEESGFEAGPISREFTLEPGDCAYVPRGVMHDAENVGSEPSLHITVGLFTRKWADLMLEAVSELALREPDFRRSLPAGFARGGFDRQSAEERFDHLLTLIESGAGMDAAFDLIKDNFIRERRPDISGTLAADPPVPQPGERYRMRPFVQWDVADDEGRIVLIGPGGDLLFGTGEGDALETALSGSEFTVADLECDAPEAMVTLLWTHGYLERVGS